jgi:general secretion pathway protein N
MTRRWIGIIAVAAIIFAIATFPLRLALAWSGAGDAGLSARGVTGSIWSGRVHDADWNGAALGSFDAGIAPMALLVGDVRLDAVRADALRGDLSGGVYLFGERGVADANGAVSLGASLAGVPLDSVRLTDVGVRFDGAGRCVSAAGKVQLSIALPIPGLDLSNGLSGPITCRDGRAQAALASQSGMERLHVDIDGTGAWRARLSIGAGSDPALDAVLRAAGFLPAGDALVLMRQGRL